MKNIENVIKPIIFLAGLWGILTLIGLYLKPEVYSGQDSVDVVTEEIKDTGIDDIVYIGDSESISSLNPEVMEDMGYSLYVCGTAGQKLASTQEIVEQSYEEKQEKMLIYEVNNAFVHMDWNEYSLSIVENDYPAVKYHDEWKNRIKEACGERKNNKVRKEREHRGYNPSDAVASAPRDLYLNYMNDSEEVLEVPHVNAYVIGKMKRFCDDNDIEFLMISSPSAKNWSMKKHNGMQALADKLDVTYLDCNMIKEIGIDWETDTRDGGDHLNNAGAEKLARYVGRYITDRKLVR